MLFSVKVDRSFFCSRVTTEESTKDIRFVNKTVWKVGKKDSYYCCHFKHCKWDALLNRPKPCCYSLTFTQDIFADIII